MKKKERAFLEGRITMIFHDAKTGKELRRSHYKNLITSAGVIAIARRLINEGAVANEGIITYGATGTNATAPAISDTTLGTELERKLLSVTSRSTNVATLRTFFTESESVGTLTEFGLFGEDASAAADSGTLFEHAAISETKTANETLTVEVEITVATAG